MAGQREAAALERMRITASSVRAVFGRIAEIEAKVSPSPLPPHNPRPDRGRRVALHLLTAQLARDENAVSIASVAEPESRCSHLRVFANEVVPETSSKSRGETEVEGSASHREIRASLEKP